MYLSSNQDLYNYLLRLGQGLKARGAIELSDIAMGASRQAASMSAEFLGESRIALRRILSEGKTILEPSEEADIEDALRQLTAAINRWPQKAR
jgi:hypothetical protein